MGDGIPFLDIILFALVAVFLVLRLRSVLGKRTGHEEQPPQDPFATRRQRPAETEDSDDDNVIRLPNRPDAERADPLDAPAGSLAGTLMQIKLADSSFDEKSFLDGAKDAFGMIVDAFARGDREALRPLLSNDVFADFEGAITDREGRGDSLETIIHAEPKADIDAARFDGKIAHVTVQFISEQTNVTKNREGVIVDGDETKPESVTDVWTFMRDTQSRDPNWLLVETTNA